MRRPSLHQWREAVATALDDPPVRIAYWDPATERYREADGGDLAVQRRDSGRSTVEANRGSEPVAVMAIDDALVEDPELLRAVTAATVLAVENGNLEGKLRESESRVHDVGAAERKRIQGNLHDSAQQRLVALRINLQMASERLQGSELREMQRFGAELDRAVEEVRIAASGAQPPVLLERGVAAAIRSLVGSAAMPVLVEDCGLGRRPPSVETAVYFCCAEALQNATKHAGSGASVSVRLGADDRCVEFSVEDDGIGFGPGTVRRGRGLDNMSDRIAAVGGSVSLESTPGHGTRITGRIPADA